MKLAQLTTLVLLLGTAAANGQEPQTGTVYSYIKDGVRYYSAKPPPPGSGENRSIKYNLIDLIGAWSEKAGEATYTFGDGYNFEYRNTSAVEKGVWTLATDNCAVGSTKGNLYIQAGTDRCCYNAYFLGDNLVLTALAKPVYTGVCSDRVLVRQLSSS
jgi:hypothetical protein